MADPETAPAGEPESAAAAPPEIAGTPIRARKPDAPPTPITNPDIPELQDRRRPRP
jgi:hypothetical protein